MERVGIGSSERKKEQKKKKRNSFSQTESYGGPLGIKNL